VARSTSTSRAGSAGQILRVLRERGPLTRQDLQAEFGMSRVTLVERIDALQRLRLLRQAGHRDSSGGRRAELLAADDEGRIALVADIGVSHATVALADLRARVLLARRLRVAARHRPQDTLPRIVEAGRDLLAESGRAADLCGVGMSVPGQIDHERATTVAPPPLHEWTDRPLDAELRAAFAVPVLLENDANALTFGEYLATGDREATLLGVKVGTGIGAGVVVSGVLYQGMTGAAGEIGHIRIEGREERCSCGRRGCVAAIASGHALLQALRPDGARSLEDVARRVAEGRPAAVARAGDAGRLVGTVLATVVSIINPKRLILGGIIGPLPPFVEAVRAAIHEQAHPVALHGLRIDPAVHGERSALVGLAGLVADLVFSPATVDARLG
jgi:predicted NBD/HSP70 family sugar kinase